MAVVLKLEEIPVDGRLPIPCDFDVCELDAAVFVTAPEIQRDNGQAEIYDRTPLCTGHAHVVVAEAMVGL